MSPRIVTTFCHHGLASITMLTQYQTAMLALLGTLWTGADALTGLRRLLAHVLIYLGQPVMTDALGRFVGLYRCAARTPWRWSTPAPTGTHPCWPPACRRGGPRA